MRDARHGADRVGQARSDAAREALVEQDLRHRLHRRGTATIRVPDRAQQADLAASFPWGAILVGMAVGAVVSVATWLASAAITYIASATYEGGSLEPRQAFRKALSRLPTLTALYLLTLLIIMGILILGAGAGAFLFAISSDAGRLSPGPAVFVGILVFVAAFAAIIFINVRWALAVPVTALESTGVLETLRVSWRLVAGSTWRVIGFLVVIGLTVGMVAFVLTLIVTIAVGAASLSVTQVQQIDPVRLGIANTLSLLIGTALLPFTAVATLLLYFDLKWRAGGAVPQPGVPGPSVPEQQP